MPTEKEIFDFATSFRSTHEVSFCTGVQYGAIWATGRAAAEIAEMLEVVKSLKAAYEVLMQDVKAVNKHFKPLPQEKAALSRADELLKKYGK